MKHIEPSEINIINYLAGEMTNEELKQFELQLDKNELLKAQVDEMRNTQLQMGVWKDEDIQIPNLELANTNSHIGSNFIAKRNLIHLPNWMKYAAAFLGFVLLLQITGFKVNHDGNTLLLSFGEPNSQQLDASDVDEIVAKAIDTYSKDQNNQLKTLKNELNADLSNIAAAVNNISTKHESNSSQLKNIFDQNMQGQYVRLESMIRDIEDNQRQDLEDSFTGLVEYIENKRVKDQYKIQNAFSEIVTAIDNQQYQTNALLTSISKDEVPSLKSY